MLFRSTFATSGLPLDALWFWYQAADDILLCTWTFHQGTQPYTPLCSFFRLNIDDTLEVCSLELLSQILMPNTLLLLLDRYSQQHYQISIRSDLDGIPGVSPVATHTARTPSTSRQLFQADERRQLWQRLLLQQC